MKNNFLFIFFFLFLLKSGLAQKNEFIPGDNLVIDGVPKIDSTLISQADRYTNMRSARFLGWHPVNKEILISTRFGETNQIHLVKSPEGARTQITFFKDAVSGADYNPVDGRYIIFSKDIGGNEFYQKYRLDRKTNDITLLTDGKSRNVGGVWSNSGNLLAYGSTRRTGQDIDIWTIDPMNPLTDKMVAKLQGGGWDVMDWSSDNSKLLLTEEISINESYLWLLDISTGEKKILTDKKKDEKAAFNGACFSKDGKGIYVSTDKDSEFLRLAYFDLSTGKFSFLTSHIHWDIEEFKLSYDGKFIAFISNEDGFSKLHLFDIQSNTEKTSPQLPSGIISGMEWHKNNKDIAFTMSNARTSSDVYSFDVNIGTVIRWTYSETGGIITEDFPESELIKWKSFDSKIISGFLFRPPAKFTGKRPVIINIHGGPEGQARPGFQSRSAFFINELGICVIYPNIRGSSGYGKTFLTLDNGFLREDSYKDIGTLLDWIKTRPDLDPDRIMVLGGSYGGHMTLAISTYYPDKITCAVDIVGISNLVTFLENTSPYRRDLRRVEYGDERDPKMKEFLNKIAPLNNVAKIAKPIFIIQGGNDPRVPLSEAEQMVSTLKKNGTKVWYLMAKDEGHGFAKKKNNDYLLYSTVLFIKEFLLK